ncbi:NAC domain-containing protein 92-like [Triticum dicoccoides]|uniref:NAC domain-containing protein 92-like n=1 Tax=Triticum dicoccoides TaxID=85692 RepID=UPI00189024F9|nr:NAC domain-containing protein 92-like [Triticum dicoccoides]
MGDVPPVMAAAAELHHSPLPGFRFYPTDQELVVCFLTRKVLGLPMDLDIIPVVDYCRFEPHQLPDKSFSPSTDDPGAKLVWYFFAPRSRKYPTGFRMERATPNGFWKSTGKDRPVMHNGAIVGMKKTLVFHAGRAPRGMHTDWIMHEYRLHGHHIQETYALCRVFNKNTMIPSTDVSSGADADEDPMHFVPDGVDMNPDLMEYVFDGANSDTYLNFTLEGIKTDNGPTVNNNLMHFLLDGVNTDKDPIQIESMSDDAVAGNGGVQLLNGGGDKGKGGEQLVAGGDIRKKGGTDYVVGGAYISRAAMQPLTVDMKKDDAGKDKSWMEFLRGDVYWNKFIPDDGWNSSATS